MNVKLRFGEGRRENGGREEMKGCVGVRKGGLERNERGNWEGRVG